MKKPASENQPRRLSLLQKKVNSKLWLAIAAVLLFLLWWGARPIEPLHARQDAIIRTLPLAAREVKAYWQENGHFPETVENLNGWSECFSLVPAEKEGTFLIVADIKFTDDAGRKFRYACDENLLIQEQPVHPEK